MWGKKTSEPVWTNCSGSKKRHITLFEEKASCVRKRINFHSRGTTTLYCCDFQNLGKLLREGQQQGAGLETHPCVVDLCCGGSWRDCSPWRTHNRMRSSGWPGSAEKNMLCTSPASWVTCHLTQRDREGLSATCREVGTRKGGGELLDWRSVWRKGKKDISLTVGFIDQPLIFPLNSQSSY